MLSLITPQPTPTTDRSSNIYVKEALETVVKAIKVGSTIRELAVLGDETIVTLSKTVYNKGGIKKGIAFPTTISPRQFACHLSPLDSDPEASLVLAQGDLVRIELGVHVDGYIAQAGKTVPLSYDYITLRLLLVKMLL